jgi:hypothetical protein
MKRRHPKLKWDKKHVADALQMMLEQSLNKVIRFSHRLADRYE